MKATWHTGEAAHALAKESRMSIDRVQAELGVSRAWMSILWNNREWDAKYITRYAALMGVRPE